MMGCNNLDSHRSRIHFKLQLRQRSRPALGLVRCNGSRDGALAIASLSGRPSYFRA
jgi:hypothetical protein